MIMQPFVVILNILLFISCSLSAKVISYNYSPDIPVSDTYRVMVDGIPQTVIQSPVPASYVTFGMQDKVKIEIEVSHDVKWVDVRPKSAGIIPDLKDGMISFILDKPCQLSIELNGKISNPLFIFANPPEDKPSRSDEKVIYFEAGKIHKPGVIRPKSGQHIFVESGAWVVGAISATDVHDVKVSGFGIMDSSYNLQMTDEEMASIFSVSGGYKAENRYQRFIEFYDSEDIRIEGLILHNSTTWQVVPINCDRVYLGNLKLVADNPSDDGIDIVRSRSVHMENCFVRVKDDCVAIKAHLDYPDDCIVDDVLVENCVFWNAAWGNGIEIGFELHASEVKNITFRNIDIIHVESGAVFSIHNSDKAIVKNVLYEDIRIEDAGHKLIDLAIFRSKFCTDGSSDDEYLDKNLDHTIWDNALKIPISEKENYAKYRGQIQDITFRNIYLLEGNHPYSLFVGYDNNHLVKNITIENLQVYGKRITSGKDLKLYTEFTHNIVVK